MSYKGHVHDEKLKDFAEAISESSTTVMVRGNRNEVEARIRMTNSDWGLPDEIENAMKGIVICDFSNVRTSHITVYFETR